MFREIEQNTALLMKANIKRQMVLRGFNQNDLSEQLGVSQSTISRMIENMDKVNMGCLIRLSRILECEVNDFLVDISL